MDHEDAPSGDRQEPDLRSPGRRRAGSVHNSARVAAAAEEALAGFQGAPRREPGGQGVTTRAPGVRVLFESTDRAGPRATDDPSPAGDLDPIDAADEILDREPGTSLPPVWNPFRRTPDPTLSATSADASAGPTGPTTGPRIVDLHTRDSPTDVTVIATVERHGRRAHGTSVGPPGPSGLLHAVAEATVAALRMLVAGTLPVAVAQVTRSSEDDGAGVLVELAWSPPHGRQRLVGECPAGQDPGRAVMQATLDAVCPYLAAPGTAED